jgi:hypothetical protein
MRAVLAWTRLDCRRRWRSLVVLILLVALSGGVILATLMGARRTDTTLQRLNAETSPADAMVLPNKPGFDWSVVRKLPSVKALGTFALTIGAEPQGIGFSFDDSVGFPAGDLIENRTVDGAALISGKPLDPNDPDAILVSPGFIGKYGRTVQLRLPTKAQVDSLTPGEDYPPGMKLAGRVITLHAVGVGVNTFDLGTGGGPVFEPSYAFFTHYIKPLFPWVANARVILKNGEAGIPEFRKELAAATGNPNIDVDDQHVARRSLEHTATFTAIGWLLFCGVSFVASLILIGQAFVRFSAAATPDLRTLSALGLGRRQELAAAAAGPALASLLGGILAIAAAIWMTTLFPTGIIGPYEPDPGIRIEWLPLVLGSITLSVIALSGAMLAGKLAITRVLRDSSRPSAVASFARRLGLGVSSVIGVRFALEPGRGQARVPVRPALIGAVAGVLGVVGAFTFRVGIDSTADNYTKFGQTWTYAGFVSFGGPTKAEEAAIHKVARADTDIESLDDLRSAVLPINGRGTSTFSLTPLRGDFKIAVISGRAPVAADEISIGPATAKALHVGVGAHVTVSGKPYVVSGITYAPQDPHNDYTDGDWLTTSGFNRAQPDMSMDKYHEVRLSFRPGVNAEAAIKRLPEQFAPGGIGPISEFIPIDQQIELHSVRIQPMLLGGFLILLAIGAVGHGLASAVRRRRHDLAVLRSLGMTRWQTRLTIASQATVVAVVGLLFGIPLGIAAGRTGWRILADATPVIYTAPLAAIAIMLAIPATVATANVLAALPARRAARLQVSEVLRAE